MNITVAFRYCPSHNISMHFSNFSNIMFNWKQKDSKPSFDYGKSFYLPWRQTTFMRLTEYRYPVVGPLEDGKFSPGHASDFAFFVFFLTSFKLCIKMVWLPIILGLRRRLRCNKLRVKIAGVSSSLVQAKRKKFKEGRDKIQVKKTRFGVLESSLPVI